MSGLYKVKATRHLQPGQFYGQVIKKHQCAGVVLSELTHDWQETAGTFSPRLKVGTSQVSNERLGMISTLPQKLKRMPKILPLSFTPWL